jgi:hypothetical protein
MIIDRLAGESRWVRDFCNRARIIQAPFAIFPPHESSLKAKTALVPRDGQLISGQFAKPPFESVVMFGNGEEGREQGALFVASASAEAVESELVRNAPSDTSHVLAVTVVGKTQRFDCLVVYRFLVLCGEHYTAPPHMDLVVHLSRQAFLDVNGFGPEQAGATFQIDSSDWESFIGHQVGALAACFALLNCRNVVRKTVSPDAKLQRARKKSNKLPLYSFSTLAVAGFGVKGAVPRAIHWVRGHFKEYTPERPLFGKIAGLFWWEPHLVGGGEGSAIGPSEDVLYEASQ